MNISSEVKIYPKVFIIVLNYNGKGLTGQCLLSLYKLNYPDFQIVVVDNNSQDGSLEEIKQKFPRAICIKNEENLGFSAGNNVGIRFSLERMADYVLLLNQDTKVKPDFLSKMIKASQNNPGMGILSPLITGKAKELWFCGGKVDWMRMKVIHDSQPKSQKVYETNFISGCAMLVKKEVFGKIGLLDEDFFLYWEDADFSVRSRRAGYKLGIVPASMVVHFEQSEEKKANKIYWLVLSGLIFFRKNSSGWLKLWIFIYTGLRRAKNFIDVKYQRNQWAKSVQKAYGDFKKYVN